MKKFLSIMAILTLAIMCGSWGPITHNSLAGEIASGGSTYELNYQRGEFYEGCIAPDIALAAKPGTWDARQNQFHSGEYVDALKSLQGDSAARYYFVCGYEVHLLCDGIESQYTAMKKAPVSSDFGVDRLVGASGGSGPSAAMLTFMLEAWNKAYGVEASGVTASWLKSAVSNFGFYMSGIYNPVSQADAEKYFSDYRAWYDQSVVAGIEHLQARNAEILNPPVIEPPPTITTTPPTMANPPIIPNATPSDGDNIKPLPISPRDFSEPFMSFVKTILKWFGWFGVRLG